jgi:hypothetical protein
MNQQLRPPHCLCFAQNTDATPRSGGAEWGDEMGCSVGFVVEWEQDVLCGKVSAVGCWH